MLRTVPLVALLAVLAACGTAPRDGAGAVATRALPRADIESLPVMKRFGGSTVQRPQRPNSEMARDFLDLTFQLESGRPLPVLTRFEGPVTIRTTGNAPPTLGYDLDRLLSRLVREAGVPITRVRGDRAANITVESVPRDELQRMVPNAACFVSPRISSWAEFRASRRGAQSDWTTLTSRDRMAIFVPNDVSPQEVRDCLHEEIAQALGPVNDLYRLPDSVFNDDNFHTVLTGFDMLMLRVTYDPALQSGMTPAEVAAQLPAILARLNPAGGRGGINPPDPTPRAWIEAIEAALGARSMSTRRRASAERAVDIAMAQGWRDGRRAFSQYALGRLVLSSQPDLALASFLQAEAIYRSRPETRLQAAHVGVQLAAYALSSGNPDAVIRITDAALPAAARAENAVLMAQLMMMKAEALALAGRVDEARVVRLDSLGWARYGFGSETEVRARAAEIAALSPKFREASAR